MELLLIPNYAIYNRNTFMKDERPLAKITYICNKCGHQKFKYELYHTIYSTVQQQCGTCNRITVHSRILPEDDDIKNYRRPTMFF